MKLSGMPLAVALILATAAPLRALETVTVGGAIVTIAKGWTHEFDGDAVTMKPADLPQGVGCTFSLPGGEKFDGPLEDRLTAEWKDFQALGRVIEDDGGKVTGAGTAVELAQRAGVIEKQDVNLHVWFLIAKSHGRIDRMVFVASSADAFRKYGQDVATMVSGARYVAPKPLEPLAGVCFGFSQVKTERRPECWVFLPDGVAYHGFPIGGPDNMDVDAHRKSRPKQFGRYETRGDQIVVTMNGQKEPTTFAPSGGAWAAAVTREFRDRWSGPKGNTISAWTDNVQTTLRIAKAQPCDDLKLAGTYRLPVDEGRYAPRAIPTIKFTEEGQFTEDGLVHESTPAR
jgi:hypothetical protein